MSKQVVEGKIIGQGEIAPMIYKMIIQAPEVVQSAHCGQFVNVYPKSKSTILPRPISISEIGEDTITLVYGVVGEGTREFMQYETGDMVRISTAIGNGYTVQEVGVSVLVGGGIGVPPLVELAKNIKGEKIAVLGFREDPILVETLETLGVKVYVATDSGKVGFKGNVIELIQAEGIKGDYFYACGPKVMLRALSAYCEAQNVPVQVSMEERMGCGYGVCVGCVTKIKADNEKGYELKKVCKDGPVFLGSEVKWDE
ncbi:MAG: dihydroorotate dehydrogenase electron transfer subunit [Cellulosilyticum sp.]|nr:dihydroorotate dehydrogenase electron transfer subunit [Cellulosilyticum sp.]